MPVLTGRQQAAKPAVAGSVECGVRRHCDWQLA
jgi:hypothetical protein